ncbi:hypothetical protein B0H16DRAFT_1832343 [Mycena metata]|uniref:DUF6534 domain-containing protein n=1 Tax=Mycena metata TaxID=1033252 RepID=A0AAD7NC17_9AGAR|nr:hypothetical protein B0H16DRAFT_1832343 [Mycena metata]
MHPMKPLTAYGPAELAHGPLMIGFLLNAILYGIMINQTYLYFTTFPGDKRWMKIFVACIFVLDTFNTFFDFAYLYDALIVHFGEFLSIYGYLLFLTRHPPGDVPLLSQATWVFATDPIMTAAIASLVQLFFAKRIHVLTGKLWLTMIVVACALTGIAGGLATSVEVLLEPYFKDFIHFKNVVIVWLAAECAADLLITTILGAQSSLHDLPVRTILVRSNEFPLIFAARLTPVSSHKTGMEDSDVLIDRIIRLTVQTGLATALCAAIDLILFLTDPIGLHLIFNIPLCKLYTNSLLSSLNARKPQGAGSADSGQGLMVSKRASIPAPSAQFRRSSVFIDVESARTSDVEGMQEVV